MMTPLQDRVLVRLDESIASAQSSGIYIPPKTDAFRSKGGAIEGENRGTIVSTGPGKVTDEGVALGMAVQPGDVVRFSELEYPCEMIEGRKHVLISEQDILWVEEVA